MIGVPTCPACGAYHYEEQCPMVRRFRRALLVLPLLLCSCATIRTGIETAALAGHISAARADIGRTRAEAKQIVLLVHGASDLQRRIDFKTARAIKLLDQ